MDIGVFVALGIFFYILKLSLIQVTDEPATEVL